MKKILILILAVTLVFTSVITAQGAAVSDDGSRLPVIKATKGKLYTTDRAAKYGKQLWEALEGCWTAADERFANFTYKKGVPAFYAGKWENLSPRGAGTVYKFTKNSSTKYTLVICYPAYPKAQRTTAAQAKRLYQTVVVNLSDYDQDGKIKIKVGEKGITRQYAYGGVSYDDAYDIMHPAENATFGEISEIWSELKGFWNGAEERFFSFNVDEKGNPTFNEGFWNAGWRTDAVFEKAMSPVTMKAGEGTKLLFVYPATLGGEDGPLPETSVVVYIDMSGIDRDGKISVKTGEDGQWVQAAYGGADAAAAYEAVH